MFFTNFFQKQKHNNHIGFENMKLAINNKKYTIINTLSLTDQTCLIKSTIDAQKEESTINELLAKYEDTIFIIYGRNSTDDTPTKKYDQLIKLGFEKVYIYSAGLFEWLLLQNVYGEQEFPTTTICKDLLPFRPLPIEL
jgi:hypothetical protein